MNLLLSKKAIFGPGGGVGGPRQPISGVLGLLFLALGIIPLLNTFGVIPFNIPPVPHGIILWVLAVVGGAVLLWDALIENMPTGIEGQLRMASLIGGLILLVIGIIPILNHFGILGFGLPSFIDMIKNVLFTIAGVLLLYGAAKQF
ncbi:hypothetical protein CMO88_02180 [Candidatus Woesearchaeota archaeon]|nr:hypothetical protein [Candidatus Woesearchaeota archaeon]|tara:strand:+ start:360 stop:797 length:438 start_codon:yes stop_codon:yes gene_type:complete